MMVSKRLHADYISTTQARQNAARPLKAKSRMHGMMARPGRLEPYDEVLAALSVPGAWEVTNYPIPPHIVYVSSLSLSNRQSLLGEAEPLVVKIGGITVKRAYQKIGSPQFVIAGAIEPKHQIDAVIAEQASLTDAMDAQRIGVQARDRGNRFVPSI